MTYLLLSWTVSGTGSGLSKPGEQVVIVVMALLLMPMVIAILQVVLKKVQPLVLLL